MAIQTRNLPEEHEDVASSPSVVHPNLLISEYLKLFQQIGSAINFFLSLCPLGTHLIVFILIVNYF